MPATPHNAKLIGTQALVAALALIMSSLSPSLPWADSYAGSSPKTVIAALALQLNALLLACYRLLPPDHRPEPAAALRPRFDAAADSPGGVSANLSAT